MTEEKGQFEDPFPKASHALGKLTEAGKRRLCKGQGFKAAGAVIMDSDIRSLIHSERRVLGAEAGTSPVPEENKHEEVMAGPPNIFGFLTTLLRVEGPW